MDFVSFSLNYWDDLWQSRHQIMLSLARTHKVLFVSPPFPLSEVLLNLRKRHLPKSGLMHREGNLYTLVFSKWLFKTYRYPRLEKIMWSLRKAIVRHLIRKLGFRETVLFIWHPFYGELVGAFGESLCCYYVDDEFSSYAEETEEQRQRVMKQEDMLLERADVVFANGPALLKVKNRHNNAINVPMAADFELFSRSRLKETVVPDDMERIPHPRITYIGNLNDKIDFELLCQLSSDRPGWSFVLVGPTNVRSAETKLELKSLQSRPNVHFLGGKPREKLPSYIKGADVCLMCYRKDKWAYYVYPLKLHEYLASGKPVIGTDLMSLREFEGVIRIATTPKEWREAIEASLAEKDLLLANRRVQVAYDNRLEARIAAIEEALEQKLGDKNGRVGSWARNGR
jgi:glycosyltransferase involved in cell wall biosynthesis